MYFTTFVLLIVVLLSVASVRGKTRLLIISFDGFRWDYLDKMKDYTTNFNKFASEGTRAEYIKNVFCTKTFPSHVTLSTGLYEESHGIVSNTMYDPLWDKTFTRKWEVQSDPRWWEEGVPIWITAEEQGKKAGTFFWPGSEVSYFGKRQSKWVRFNTSIPYKTRVDRMVDWMVNDGLDFGAMYMEEPDRTGHSHMVPNSPEMKKALKKMDDLVGYLIKKLKSANIYETTNIILTGDHGMTNFDPSKFIDLSRAPMFSNFFIEKVVDNGAVLMLNAKRDSLIQLETMMTDIKSAKFHNMSIYRKEDIPDRLHYKNHRRITDLVVIADLGYYISLEPIPSEEMVTRGVHGYDPMYRDMNPIFMARGPNIQIGKVVKPFEQVDIYVLMSKLLGITPRANNGSLDRVKDILQLGSGSRLQPVSKAYVTISVVMVVSVLAGHIF